MYRKRDSRESFARRSTGITASPEDRRILAGMAKPEAGVRVLAQNRRAHHDYHILETLEAGLQLAGTEVKSARDGKVQLKDSFVELRDREAWLVRAHIGPYTHGNRQNHEPERARAPGCFPR